MFESFRRSWELVKASYQVLKSDKELVVFPIVSFVGVVLVSLSFLIPLLGTGILDAVARDGRSETTAFGVIHVIILFLFYLVMYTVIIFCQSALIGAAMIRLKGGDPTLSDGFRIARQHLTSILGYAAISATVGMILQALSSSARSNNNLLGRLVAEIVISLIGMAWTIVTFLVVPILVMEHIGPIEAIKRSAALLKKTWGEQLIGNSGIGAVFGLATLAIVLVAILLTILFAQISGGLAVLVVIVAVVAVLGLSLLGSTLSGIYQAVLYLYATEGQVSAQFPSELVQGAFKPKAAEV
jgi:hypothetical protein